MTKLKITRCEVSSGDIVPMSGEGNVFSTAINPSAFSCNYKTGFSSVDDDTAIGKSEPVPKYHRSDAEQLSLAITLDGTGVVRSTVDTTVTDQLEHLRNVAYSYNGDNHEPNLVEIECGDGLSDFQGRMTALEIDYSLFRSDGTPLRATVKMVFIEALPEEMEAKESNDKSPI